MYFQCRWAHSSSLHCGEWFVSPWSAICMPPFLNIHIDAQCIHIALRFFCYSPGLNTGQSLVNNTTNKTQWIQGTHVGRQLGGRQWVYFVDPWADLRGFCKGPEKREESILGCLTPACRLLVLLHSPSKTAEELCNGREWEGRGREKKKFSNLSCYKKRRKRQPSCAL